MIYINENKGIYHCKRNLRYIKNDKENFQYKSGELIHTKIKLLQTKILYQTIIIFQQN